MANYTGILFIGQSIEGAGRGIAGYRLRSAAKKAGFNVLVIDTCAELRAKDLYAIINKCRTGSLKFLGFSMSWIAGQNEHNFTWFKDEFFQALGRMYPELLIISGGHRMGLVSPLIPYTKYHFHGFSDHSFVEFLKHIHGIDNSLIIKEGKLPNGVVIDGNTDHAVEDINSIETELEPEDGFLPHQPIPIEISRGCIFRCAFCHHPYQDKKDYDSYMRTPENIARELRRNYDLFGTTRYSITDDTFNDSIEKIDRLKRAIDIAKLPNFEFVGYIRPDIIVTKPEMVNMLMDVGLKGAFFGIESFNQESRRAVGKGTDINKVIEVGHRLAERKVLIHAGMIVGLPGDTRETVMKAHEYLMSGQTPFKFWIWAGLFLKLDSLNLDDAKSTLDKNPAGYGYSFTKEATSDSTSFWYNKHFNANTAGALAKELNDIAQTNMRYAGWRVAGGWHMGKTNEEMENEIIPIKEFDSILKKQNRIRAQDQLNQILNVNDQKDY